MVDLIEYLMENYLVEKNEEGALILRDGDAVYEIKDISDKYTCEPSNLSENTLSRGSISKILQSKEFKSSDTATNGIHGDQDYKVGEADLNPFYNRDGIDNAPISGSMVTEEDVKRIIKQSSKREGSHHHSSATAKMFQSDDLNPLIHKSQISPSKSKKAGFPDPDNFNPRKFDKYFY